MNAVATEKQVALITKLTAEKDWTAAPVAAPIQELLAGVELTRKEASGIIDIMFKLPSIKKPAAFVKVADGFYVLNDTIYKVQTSPDTGRTYAKKLGADGSFVYSPGAVGKLAKAEKLTLELAKQYGKLYGMCVICGRTLTNEESITAGIGPICSGKL